ncbi:MAG: UDP-3-O-(3-hydroxymyristoyl)glucosamine N-acyltransferase [Rubricella sp.]
MTAPTVAEIARALGARFEGAGGLALSRPRRPQDAGEGDLALAMDPAFLPALEGSPARAAVVPEGTDWAALGLDAAILVGRSRYAMAGIGRAFEVPPQIAPGIHPSAVIDPTAQIGEGAAIGPFVVIGAGARIGARARILPHVWIAEEARIGADALLYTGVRICARVTIGDRFIAQPGCVIGSDGFSFVTPDPSHVEAARAMRSADEGLPPPEWTRINSLGSVRIGDDVEVGSNSTVDRGTVADTVIGKGTKLDNLVHVGHNVQVGETCLLCGQTGIAGSVVIGDRVVLGGQVGVADHVTIGHDVIAAAQTGIMSDAKPEQFLMGFPATRRDAFVQDMKARRRLPRLMERLKAVENRLSKDDPSG